MAWRYPLNTDIDVPILPNLGAFAAVRKNHTHEGVDLYVKPCAVVHAVEDGIVVRVIPFTGEIAGSPWWNNTQAVLVEGESGVVVYGEIRSVVKVGEELIAGNVVGDVLTVLKKDKGRPMSMLHLELHIHGTRDVYEWLVDGPKPESLLDPTEFLLTAIP